MCVYFRKCFFNNVLKNWSNKKKKKKIESKPKSKTGLENWGMGQMQPSKAKICCSQGTF